MASPSSALTTLRPDLGSMLEFDLAANMAGFIAYRILPIINVMVAAGTFGRIPTEQLGKLASVIRTSTGNYNRIKHTFTEDSFATKEYGLEGVVDQRNARLYERYFNAEVAALRLTLHNVLAQAERRVAALLFNETTFSGRVTSVTTEWSDLADGLPITDVRTAAQSVRDACGMYPNCLTISRKVFRNLQDNAQIIDRIESAGAGTPTKPTDITAQMLARCFDIDEVLVADSSYDSATEGQATTFADIWDDEYALLAVKARTNSIEEPCVGRTFHWGEDGSKPEGLVESYESNEVRGDVVRVRHEVHEKCIYPETGWLLKNITA